MGDVSRRSFVGGLAATLAIGAFDEASRGWLSVAEAQRGTPLPRLDGALCFDPAAIAEAADDFGHLVSRAPWAVLQPGSVRDVVRMVRFADRHRLRVAMRGQGHSVFGQAQADAGIVIDSRSLSGIYRVDAEDGVWVDAGVTWRDLVAATVAQGLTPRVLTDYLGLSVGGVLSVGGMGGATHRHGMVVDNVAELEVVTGDGRHLRCSPRRHAGLFRAVLGGLGQFALILRARIELTPARSMARIYQLVYPSLDAFVADQRRVVRDERFDFLEGQVVPNPAGGWLYVMEAGAWFDPGSPPDDAALLADLSPLPGPTIVELPYLAWVNRVEQFVAFWQANGLWDTPHPWSDLFVPDRAVETTVGDVMARLGPADVGAGVTLLYPFKRRPLESPSVQVPDDEILWLFDILRFPPPDPALVAGQLADNRAIFEQVRDAGGKRYPIGAVRFEPADWIAHYGPSWFFVLASKARFDPRATLTPGQGVFLR